jgi:two-component system response regulator FlrC
MSPLSGLRILCVEDESIIALALQAVLTRASHRVTLAANGLAALRALVEKPAFDLLVTDMRMPRMAGDELIRHVRVTHPHLPIIVLSACTDEMTRSQLRGLDGTPILFIDKPVCFEELLSALPASRRVALAG